MSPVRKPRNHSKSFTGKFPSQKMNRMIHFESGLEKDFIYMLEFDPRVSSYEEQPVEFRSSESGKVKKYTPDFGAWISGEYWIYECKPTKFLTSKDNPEKFAFGERECSARGWFYQVVTDDLIRKGHKLRNVKYLTSYSRFEVSPVITGKIFSLLMNHKTLRVVDIINLLSSHPANTIQATVFHLAYRHLLVVSLEDAVISNQSIISMN